MRGSVGIGFMFAVLALLPAVAGGASADEDPPPDLMSAGPLPPAPLRTVEGVRDRWSERVVGMGRWMDALFGADDYVDDVPGSWVRVGSQARFDESGWSFEQNLSTRVALPRTEERLSLILDLEGRRWAHDEDERAQTVPAAEDFGGRAGLGYLYRLAEAWSLDLDAGVRLRWPLDPYVRARVRREADLAGLNWRVGQSLFWYERIGEGATTDLRVQRELGWNQLLRSTTEATWLERDQQFYYGQVFSYSRSLRYDRGIIYQAGLQGGSEPNHRVEQTFVTVRWRRSVGWPWLFLEVSPEVIFDREQDFHGEPRIFFTLEAIVGDLSGAR